MKDGQGCIQTFYDRSGGRTTQSMHTTRKKEYQKAHS